MALNAANVRVGVNGEVNFAEAPATLPADAAALLTDFTGLGYNTDAGVAETINETTTDIKAWQGGQTVRTVRTDETVTYAFTMLETNVDALAIYYGNDVDVADGSVKVGGQLNTRGSWVIDVLDGTDIVRVVIPDGEVTQRGTVNYVNDNAISYPVTVTAYPSNETGFDGANAKKYHAAFAA